MKNVKIISEQTAGKQIQMFMQYIHHLRIQLHHYRQAAFLDKQGQ
jgi:hypothetical protein